MLASYTETSFASEGFRKPVYTRGAGAPVIVMHELPGITPEVTRFADWVVDAGFRVYLPLLVGEAGRPLSFSYLLTSFATVCIRREFAMLAADRASPVTGWLRALARHALNETGGASVGAIGMCLSGNFVLSMMMEPAVVAPVLSHPCVPLALGKTRKAGLNIAPQDWQCVKERCAAGARLMGLRFKGDPMSPPERFERLKHELGDAFEAIEIEERYGNPASHAPKPHSVVTYDLIDEDGQPTKEAAKRVIAFFVERLKTA